MGISTLRGLQRQTFWRTFSGENYVMKGAFPNIFHLHTGRILGGVATMIRLWSVNSVLNTSEDVPIKESKQELISSLNITAVVYNI